PACAGMSGNGSVRTGHVLAFRTPLEVSLQTIERHARSAARKAPACEVIVLNILDLAQDRLARVIALAPAGFPGERIETLFYVWRQAKREHVSGSNVLYMYSRL